jgi:hypothetical protein
MVISISLWHISVTIFYGGNIFYQFLGKSLGILLLLKTGNFFKDAFSPNLGRYTIFSRVVRGLSSKKINNL